MKNSYFLLIPFLFGISSIFAAPANYQNYNPSNPLKDSVDRLRHQLGNQDVELNACQQKLESFQVILEGLQDQIQEQGKSQKEQFKKDSLSLEMKLASLENTAKSLAADIKELHTHANETSHALQAIKQKLAEGDQRALLQSSNIENLQSVIQTLMEALQVKADLPNSAASNGTYKVKAGDSLEKIARIHGTTVQVLKDLNHMTSDKIVVGKNLKIPE